MALNVMKQLVGAASKARKGSNVSSSSTGEGPTESCNSGCMRDQHLATLEGAREEATLLFRNYYKASFHLNL